MKKQGTYTILLACFMLAIAMLSCNHPDNPEAICLASDFQNEQTAVNGVSPRRTPAPQRAPQPLRHDFVVWGYKTLPSGDVQTVFQGYNVKYTPGSAGSSAENAYDYSYVGVAPNQTIKYWDFGASEYNFWGTTMNPNVLNDPTDPKVSSDGTSFTLTISGLTQSLTEPDVTEKMFSALYHREPVSKDVVQLQFKRPYAKVRVLFYTNTTLADNTFDNIKISGITFGPESPKQIVTGGNLKVKYPKNGEGPEVYSTTSTASADNLTFEGNVQLDHDHGTSSDNAVIAVPTGGSEYYYVVPNDYASPFTLSAKIDNEDKTAVVPASFMDWRPNFVYTYIFKISGGKYMEFYDVQIDPWRYGGSQEEEDWKNW